MTVQAIRCAAVAMLILSSARLALAQEQVPPGMTLRTSLKASLLLSRAPDDPVLFADRTSVTSFWRWRVEPLVRVGRVAVETAYEQRLRLFSTSAATLGAGVLPPEVLAPYRLRPLDWQLAASPGSAWRHEIDRLNLQLRAGRADWTIGRQAVGWGRGVMFGAVDLFSPFTPLEADREWRRGVDAVRADVKLADRVGLDAVGVLGRSIDSSAFAARVHGDLRALDVELMGGRRARDIFGGVSSSAALRDAEVHGEVAVFDTPEQAPHTAITADTLRVKMLAGGSYRFAVGSGLLVHVEYHYSGFGARKAAEVVALVASREFSGRYLRGDTQILGRHALGALASYDMSPGLVLSGQWLQSPVDGSGLVAPSAALTLSDSLSVMFSVYIPYGRPPRESILQSEYGGTPLSGFLQVRIYG